MGHPFYFRDEDLAQMMKEAELHSVKQTEQGEGAEATVKCAECGRTLTKRQPRCLYCGAEAPLQPFER